MKTNTALFVLLAGFSAIASAAIGFSEMRNSYPEDEPITIHWWQDQDYESVKMQLLYQPTSHRESEPDWVTYTFIISLDHVEAGNHTLTPRFRVGQSESKYHIYITALDANTTVADGPTTGYSALSEPIEVYKARHSRRPWDARVRLAIAAGLGALGVGIILTMAVFALVSRLRASRQDRAMTPPKWLESAVEAALVLERRRVAAGEQRS